MITKIPPHSIEAEQGVLGSILLDKDAIIQITSLILPEDFYDTKHAIIYEGMIDLFSRNRPIDLLTIRELLDDRKKIEEIG